MSEPEPHTRQIVIPIQVVCLTTDPDVTHAAIVAALEADVILPATLELADGGLVAVAGAVGGVVLEMALAPDVAQGAYGR